MQLQLRRSLKLTSMDLGHRSESTPVPNNVQEQSVVYHKLFGTVIIPIPCSSDPAYVVWRCMDGALTDLA